MLKKILATILVLAVVCVGLPMTFVSAATTDTVKTIVSLNPADLGYEAGTDVTTKCMENASNFSTVVKEDANGLYYSITATKACNFGYTFAATGLSNNPALSSEVLNKIMPYMQVSADMYTLNAQTGGVGFYAFLAPTWSYTNAVEIIEWGGVNDANRGANGVPFTYTNDGLRAIKTVNNTNPSAGTLAEGYHNTLGFCMYIGPSQVNAEIVIRNFTIGLKESDKDAINAALEGTGYSYATLTSYIPYRKPGTDHIIWEALPTKFESGKNVDVTPKGCLGSLPRHTYTYVDDNDAYYTTSDFKAAGNIWFNPQCNLEVAQLQSDAFAALRPYITVSYRVRMTNLGSSTATGAKVSLHAVNENGNSYSEGAWHTSAKDVAIDGQWHTFEISLLNEAEGQKKDDSYLGWVNGRMRYFIESVSGGNISGGVKFDIGDIKMSVNSAYSEEINAALSGTSYSYDTLTSYVPYRKPGKSIIIWEAEPARYTTDGALQQVKSSSGKWDYAPRKTYAVINDEDSYYTSSDFKGVGNAWFNPLCNLAAVQNSYPTFEKLRPYLTLSYRVRITNLGSSSATGAEVSIHAMNDYLTYDKGQWHTAKQAVAVDGQWHNISVPLQSGDSCGWSNGRMRYMLETVTGGSISTDGVQFDIGSIRLTVDSAYSSEIDTALEGTGYSYETLTSFVPYAKPDTVIWYANPETAKRAAGKDDLTVKTSHWSESQSFLNKYKTYYGSDNTGVYFHTEYTNGGQGAYNDSLYATGVNKNTPGYGWMGNKSVMDILKKYSYLSYQYRVTSDSLLFDAGSVKLCTRIGTSTSRIAILTESYVAGRGDWYEVSPTLIGWNVDTTYAKDVSWDSGYVGYNFYGNDSTAATLDIRNMQLSLPSGLRTVINKELATIDGIDNIKNFTAGIEIGLDEDGNKDYFSLFGGYVENDVNDDGILNLTDLVRAKKISVGSEKFACSAVQKRFKTKMGRLDATELVELRKALLTQESAINTVDVYPAVEHPGVVDMDAEYDMCVASKDGTLLNAADYNWTSNFGSAVTFGGAFSQYVNNGTNNYRENGVSTITTNTEAQHGIKMTVPYSVRISSKPLIVTAVSKTDGRLGGTYQFDFTTFQSNVKFEENFDNALDTESKWKIGHWSNDTTAVAPTVANGEATFTSDGSNNHPQISTQTTSILPYGCFSGKIKMSDNAGIRDGLWLACYDEFTPNPDSPDNKGGELDIFESCPINNRVSQSVHWNGWETETNNTYKWDSTYFDASFDMTEYHVYSLVWTPTAYYWYIDGVLTKLYSGEGMHTGKSSMYLVYGNSAYQGGEEVDWCGKNDTEYVGGSTTVDWIKVYGLDSPIEHK